MTDPSVVCPDCNVIHEDGCPRCGRKMYHGYGLMGGGIGSYSVCLDDNCGYFGNQVMDTANDDPT